jgi:hypothetical protein
MNFTDPYGTKCNDKCAAAKAKVASLLQQLNSPEMLNERNTYFKEMGAGALIGCGVAVLGEEIVTVGVGTPLAVGACVIGAIEGVEVANGVFILSHLGLLREQASLIGQLAIAEAEEAIACN